VDVALTSQVLLSILAAAVVRWTVDPCATKLIDRQSLIAALELELRQAMTDTSTATGARGAQMLRVACAAGDDAILLSLEDRTQSIGVNEVSRDQRSRVVALAAAEMVHAVVTARTKTASSASLETRPIPGASVSPDPPSAPWILSLRTEVDSSLPPTAAMAGLVLVAEQPQRSLLNLLSVRGSIVVMGGGADSKAWFGAALRIGAGVPLATLDSARIEAEATGGVGLVRSSADTYQGFGEARLALVAHFAISDTFEVPISLALAAIPPVGFTAAVSGGIGIPL
jgi:hypothetical protein